MYTIITIISVILIALSILSLIQDISFWYLQILDFPRIQYLVAGLVCLIILFITIKHWTVERRLLITGVFISIAIHGYMLFSYTPFASVELSSLQGEAEKDAKFSIMVANVWMKNDNSSALLRIINANQPDIIIALEVNSWWVNELKALEKNYQFKITKPFDNTYGMALYSKLPLINTKILYLSHPKVPSIHTQVQLNQDKIFNFHAVHPVPPKPSAHPDNIGEKEVALIKVGAMVAEEELPIIVAGDFNDVAWSKTSRLFKDKGKLKDIRVGRGFFNTFNAKSYIWRWPLDHVYATDDFEVIEVKSLSEFGSDHFPYFVKLYLKR